MAQNNGNDQSDKGVNGDERYTPFYAVEPILKYLKPNSTIWCPFDKEWSAFVVRLKEQGHTVINTHIDSGDDFFLQYELDKDIDYIISNPPFSVKDDVLDRLYHWGIPFMMLLPLPTLQGMKRSKLFIKYGIQLLTFDDRIGYHNEDMIKPEASHQVASSYFCYKVLPKDLIIEKLNKYDRKLKDR